MNKHCQNSTVTQEKSLQVSKKKNKYGFYDFILMITGFFKIV